MACRRCGCRMIAKVGRTHPMLICTDCGLPMDQRETRALARQRLWNAITLTVMATVGGAMALLATINEARTSRPLDDGWDRKEEGESDARGEKTNPFLLEPSGLSERLERPEVRPPERARLGSVGGTAVSTSKKPAAAASQQEPKHQPHNNRNP
jgi:hypothetical protein